MKVDDDAFLEQIIEIIEDALQAKGYKVLEGDADTSCLVSQDGIHFEVKLRMCD